MKAALGQCCPRSLGHFSIPKALIMGVGGLLLETSLAPASPPAGRAPETQLLPLKAPFAQRPQGMNTSGGGARGAGRGKEHQPVGLCVFVFLTYTLDKMLISRSHHGLKYHEAAVC